MWLLQYVWWASSWTETCVWVFFWWGWSSCVSVQLCMSTNTSAAKASRRVSKTRCQESWRSWCWRQCVREQTEHLWAQTYFWHNVVVVFIRFFLQFVVVVVVPYSEMREERASIPRWTPARGPFSSIYLISFYPISSYLEVISLYFIESYLISIYLILSNLISYDLILFHLILSHSISFHLISFNLILSNFISSNFILSEPI